jgi:hypothetical protein
MGPRIRQKMSYISREKAQKKLYSPLTFTFKQEFPFLITLKYKDKAEE